MLDSVTTFEEFDRILGIMAKHGVMTYKQGETLIQFTPKMPEFDAPTPTDSVAGGWKRHADLGND